MDTDKHRWQITEKNAKEHMEKIIGYLFLPCYTHKWLLLACLVVMISYATMSVQGDSSPCSFGYETVFFEHGWPMKYMEREQPVKAWGKRWRMYSGIYEFEYIPLFQNIAFAVGLSLLFVHLWHLHRIRCKPWQFTLKELLFLIIVISAILGAYVNLRKKYVAEETNLSELEEIGRWSTSVATDALPWYLKPLSDLGIISRDDWEYRSVEWNRDAWRSTDDGWEYIGTKNVFYSHRDADADINQTIVEQLSQDKRLFFVRSVDIYDEPRLSDKSVELLCAWVPNCTDLSIRSCPNITTKGIKYLVNHLTNLTSLSMECATIPDGAIQHIATLKALEELVIDEDTNSTTSESLKYLRNLPKLKRLGIPKHWNIDKDDREWLHRQKIMFWYTEDGLGM